MAESAPGQTFSEPTMPTKSSLPLRVSDSTTSAPGAELGGISDDDLRDISKLLSQPPDVSKPDYTAEELAARLAAAGKTRRHR